MGSETEIKISELANTNLVNDEDILMIVQNGANKKITIEKLLNAEREKNTKLEEEIESLKKNTAKNIITMKKSKGSVNISEAWRNTMLQGEEYCKIGDKLSVVDGKIKIGAGVSKVLVSVQCNGINTSSITGDKGINIKKGDTNIAENYVGGALSAYHQGLTVAPILIDVIEGDEISISLFCSATGTLQFLDCFLTVEVIS